MHVLPRSERPSVKPWILAIPSSVLLSVLYAGAHLVVWIPTTITSRSWSETIYGTSSAFSEISVLTGALLLGYLGLDLWRWSREHPDRRVHGYVLYGAALALVIGILVFLARSGLLA